MSTLTITPTREVRFFLEISNRPEALPTRPDGPLPGEEQVSRAFMERLRDVILRVDKNGRLGGAIWFQWVVGWNYEIHVLFLDTCRGLDAIKATRSAIRWMFTNTPCAVIVGNAPSTLRHAMHFAVNLGMELTQRRHGAWLKDDQRHDICTYTLTKENWIKKERDLCLG